MGVAPRTRPPGIWLASAPAACSTPRGPSRSSRRRAPALPEPSPVMKAAQVLMEILRAEGVRYLFGNPGTTELPFLDALPDSGLEYVLALQEATAVAGAAAPAQATGRHGVAN